jgi:glycerophosphoryl diester phosphodiesterase
MYQRHDRTRSAALVVLLSLLLALPAASRPLLAAARAGARSAATVNDGLGTAGPTRVVSDDATGTAALAEPPTDTTALLADFDGDHRSDLFWYGPGAKDDHLWLGRPDRNFVGVPVKVSGSYLPLLGDFNGDGRADVFWYGPGSGGDVVWFGRAGGRFAGRVFTVAGSYLPFVGDFNGDGRADVFWYGPGSGGDVVWYGRSDGHFDGRTTTVNRIYQPLVADFNGDGRADILWYAPGAGGDALWFGRSAGGFSFRGVTVNGTYRPILGDFNGDGSRDILWYGPGTAPDALWFGHPNGYFTGRATTVSGTYQPFTGDFDGDGSRDIFWYGPGTGGDVVWYGRSDGQFTGQGRTVDGSYHPLPGDFGGDHLSDVLWWAPGPADDVLWFGHSNRQFSSRSTTVDLAYDRALAIRPDTIANQYDPYGFVGHEFGSIDGHTYTNSLEAFQRNYDRGFRVFECDQVRLADGSVLVAHTGLEANYGLNKPFQEATRADLAGHKYLGRYTILFSEDLVRLVQDHPDIFVILDFKYSAVPIYQTYVRQAGSRAVRERLLPHVADQAQLNAYRTLYPVRNYVVALYHTQAYNLFDDPEVVDFVRRNRTPAVMMWWRQRDFSISLAQNSRQSRRFSRPFAQALQAAGAVVYVHSIGDPVVAQSFWDLHVGIYSDEPFPPLGTTAPALETPTFSNSNDPTPPA